MGGLHRQKPHRSCKNGSKRGLVVEEDGGPLGVIIAPANTHDSLLIEGILEAIVVERPALTPEEPQRLCLDKGFDTPAAQETVAKEDYESHTRRIGEETKPSEASKGHKPRRRPLLLAC